MITICQKIVMGQNSYGLLSEGQRFANVVLSVNVEGLQTALMYIIDNLKYLRRKKHLTE